VGHSLICIALLQIFERGGGSLAGVYFHDQRGAGKMSKVEANPKSLGQATRFEGLGQPEGPRLSRDRERALPLVVRISRISFRKRVDDD